VLVFLGGLGYTGYRILASWNWRLIMRTIAIWLQSRRLVAQGRWVWAV